MQEDTLLGVQQRQQHIADTALLCSLEISELDAKVYVIKMLTRVLSCLSFFLLVSPIHFPRPLSLLH